MKIVETVSKIPAGWLLVPTVIGAIIHTFCPQILQIGNPTQMLFTKDGMQMCIGLMQFFTGTQLSADALRVVARKGLPFLGFKYLVAYALALGFLALFGQEGVFGVSFLAFAVAVTSCNGVLYLALVAPFGRQMDLALFSILCLTSMPILPMILLGGANGGGVDWMSIISLLVPLVLGVALGFIDPKFRDMFKGGNACVLPFMGFQFGSMIDLGSAAHQLLPGLLLTAIFYVVSVPPLFVFERKALHGVGYASAASCSVAGVALSIPPIAAASAAVYATYLDAAMSQLAMALFLTTFVTPAITSAVIRWARRRGELTESDFVAAKAGK